MPRLILSRLAIILLSLILVNFSAFAYALVARSVQRARKPYGSSEDGLPPLLSTYQEYARGLLRGDPRRMPVGVTDSVADALARAAGASLGLPALALMVRPTMQVAAMTAGLVWTGRGRVPRPGPRRARAAVESAIGRRQRGLHGQRRCVDPHFASWQRGVSEPLQ